MDASEQGGEPDQGKPRTQSGSPGQLGASKDSGSPAGYGSWLVGTVVSASDPVLAERIAQAFDFVWIDLEHSAIGVRDAQVLAIATKAGGASTFVRLPHVDSEILEPVLDAGVDGVVVPRIDSASQAERLVRRVRYPPRGSRGFAPRRATRGRAGVATISALKPVACIAQIETQEALASLESIAATDGIDALVVGTADLSLDIGAPLDLGSSVLQSAVATVGEVALRYRKQWGVALGALPQWLRELPGDGPSMLVFSSDIRLYADAIDRSAEDARAWGRLLSI